MLEDINLRTCLEFAVKTEETGAQFYGRLSKRFSATAEVADTFAQLGRDEVVHQNQFSKLLSSLPQEAGVTWAPEKSEYVKAMSISEFFSRTRGPFARVDEIESRDDALEAAFGLEKATLGFYEAVQDQLGDNEELAEIIEAEKGHVVALMKVMMTGARFRSLQDKW
jgi:rubrerythrin